MALDGVSLWDKAGVSHVDFNTNVALIASVCGGDGIRLQNYLNDPLRQERQDAPDRYLSVNLQRLGLDLKTDQASQERRPELSIESPRLSNNEPGSRILRDSYEECGEGYEGDADSLKSAGIVTDMQTHLLVDKFLDRVAEFASTRHGAKHVVSAALTGATQLPFQEEVADTLTTGQTGGAPPRLLLTKNEPFTQAEKDFLEHDFPKLLQNISIAFHSAKHHLLQGSKDALWEAMTKFSRGRVADGYIPDFLAQYRDPALQDSKVPIIAAVVNVLKPLADICQKAALEPAKVGKAVTLAHELRSSLEIQSCWERMPRGSMLYKLLIRLMFLGRVRGAFKTFLEVCTRLPTIQSLDSVCLPPVSASEDTSEPSMCALDALLSKLKPAEKKVKAIRRRYENMTSQKLHVHAEIQLIFHEKAFSDGHYSYIGGSKRPCFLCALFLQEMGVRSKPSHGGLYTRWTLPSAASNLGFTNSQADKFCLVLSNMQQKLQVLRTTLEEAGRLSLGDPEPQSSVGFTIPELRQSSTDQNARQMYVDIAADKHRRDGITQTTNYDAECTLATSQAGAISLNSCSMCGKDTARCCARCESISYCSPACYDQDRAFHLRICKTFTNIKLACPGPGHRLCFFLPVDSSDMQVHWVPVETKYDDGTFEVLHLGHLVGPERATSYIEFDVLHHRDLDRTVAVIYCDGFLKDGSKPNRCVANLAGATVHTWRGPFVIGRHPLIPGTGRTWFDKYENVCMEDLTTTLTWFREYSRTRTEEPSPTVPEQKGTAEQVVRINCDRCISLYGWPRFESRAMLNPRESQQARSRQPSAIAAMLGFSIFVSYESIDELELNEIVDVYDSTLRKYIGPLHEVIDLESRQWGWFGQEVGIFEDFTGNWIIYADSDLPLTADLVENICRFCKDLQAVFERALDPTVRHPLTREQVMAAICPAIFRKAVSKYEEGKVTWTEQHLAPWEV